jgi:hypothetical protein
MPQILKDKDTAIHKILPGMNILLDAKLGKQFF